MTNVWFNDDVIEGFNGTFEEEYHRDDIDAEKIVTHIGDWVIERCASSAWSSDCDQWHLHCNGNSVYWNKDLAKVYIAFGTHLAGIGK